MTDYYRKLKVGGAAVATEAVHEGIVAGLGYVKPHAAIRPVRLCGQLNPAVTVKPGHNMLRHAGAIYAIKLANAVVPDPLAVEVMQRSTTFMRACCFAEVDGKGTGMWEPPALTHSKAPQTFKPGGVGLAIVALASTESVRPGATTAGEMQGSRVRPPVHEVERRVRATLRASKGGYRPPGDVLPEMVLRWMALYERHPIELYIGRSMR